MKTSEILKLARDFKLATPEQVRLALIETSPPFSRGSMDFRLHNQFGRYRYVCLAVGSLESVDDMQRLGVHTMLYVNVAPWSVFEGKLQQNLWCTPRLWFKGLGKPTSDWGIEQRVLAQAERIRWLDGLIKEHEARGD